VGVILHSGGTLTNRGGEEEEHDLLVGLSIMVAFGGASRRQRVATGTQGSGELRLLHLCSNPKIYILCGSQR
jgi:hypothetical protein